MIYKMKRQTRWVRSKHPVHLTILNILFRQMRRI